MTTEIEVLKVYEFEGKMFDSPDCIRKHVENLIGNTVIDAFRDRLKPPDYLSTTGRLLLLEVLVEHKEKLAEWLSIVIETSIDRDVSEMVNILDY